MKAINKFIALVFLCLMFSSFTLSERGLNRAPKVEKPYMIVGQMPQFPGGRIALQRYIRDNLTYPFEALKHNVQGKVNVEFVVDKDGKLTEIRTVGTKLGYGIS